MPSGRGQPTIWMVYRELLELRGQFQVLVERLARYEELSTQMVAMRHAFEALRDAANPVIAAYNQEQNAGTDLNVALRGAIVGGVCLFVGTILAYVILHAWGIK